jgi:enamine deaminase RidA (YjgF/YER057c/UK114 family)
MPVQRRVDDVTGLAPANGYSHAVVSTGATAYVAGQVAVDEDGALVGPGDVGALFRPGFLVEVDAVVALPG